MPIPILLVEDSDEDILLSRNSLQRAGVANPVFVVKSGDRALAYLQGEGDYADRERFPLPGIMLLDLKMPRMNGFEVLEWMREQELLEQISVLVLTSSPEDRDRVRARELGAKAYLVKPPTPEGLREVLKLFPQCAPAESN